MIWIGIAVALGLAMGVGILLVVARPVSLHSAPKKRARKTTTPPKPVAPALQVERHHDSPPQVAPFVDFPNDALRAAWRRQGGLCAQCGRLLIWANRNRDSGIGAWQSHHRIPRSQGGTSDLKNCVLFCSGAGNCHFNIGHGGIGWDHYSVLEDDKLTYLRRGAEAASTTASQTRPRPSLIRKIFGIATPPTGKKHAA